MNRTEIKQVLDKLTSDIKTIADDRTASILKTLLNLVEVLVDENSKLQKDNQSLKDEVNLLKGEQGKPNIRKQSKDDDQANANHSSDSDRKKRNSKKKSKKKKNKNIKIDRRVTVDFNKDILPADAIFKGYEKRTFQDLRIITDNVEFSLPVYYSPSLNKTFMAPLPDDYYGEFGPGLRSLVITLYRDSGMTEPAIERFLKTFNIQISKATISRMITERHDSFHQEKEDIINAGLKASPYQHIDDTGCRVDGKNQYAHILCNPYFTAFFTRPKKDRLTILEILCRGELKFKFNNEAYTLMSELGLATKNLVALKKITNDGDVITNQKLDDILNKMFPNPKKHKAQRRIIREAAAIIYYQSSEYAILHLICDDAPQFNKIAKHKSLCWVHEGRHYKKLNPIVTAHKNILNNFIEQFWDYYGELLAYKQNPSATLEQQLSKKFDTLFSIKTGYDLLDERIAMTLAKKASLLLVLRFPFLPLHNNPAELGSRVQARIRDVNLQTISVNGTKTKDTFATIVQTARKLGVNIYNYVYDRVSKKLAMPSLADLITEKSSLPHNTS